MNKLSVDDLRARWNSQVITEGEVPLQTFEEFLTHRLNRALGLIKQLEERLAEAVHTERNQYWYKTEIGLGEQELDHMQNRLHEERIRTLELLGWTVQPDEDYHTNVYHYDGRYVHDGSIRQHAVTASTESIQP